MSRQRKALSGIFYDPSAEGHMLIQDIASRIMPYRRFGDVPVVATIQPANKDVENLISFAIGADFRGRDLEYAAAEFVREAAMILFTYGQVFYRVRIKENPYKQVGSQRRHPHVLDGLPSVFVLDWLRPEDTRVMLTGVYHLERNESAPRKLDWIKVPRKELIRFKIQDSGVKWSPFTISQLRFIDSAKLWCMTPKLDKRTKMPQFDCDVAEQSKLIRMATAYLCAPCGWNGRQSFDEYTTAYFMIERQLRFAEFLIELREYIIARLNQCFAIAGAELGFQAKLELKGLLQKETITHLRQDVQGGRKIADVLKELLTLL